MDFIKGLLKSKGVDTIFIKAIEICTLYRLQHPFSALSVVEAFVRVIVCAWVPSIISDRDRVFLSNFWKDLFMQGTKLKRSTIRKRRENGDS